MSLCRLSSALYLHCFLSVPMNFMERKVLAGKQFDKMRRTLAILITLVLVFGIIGQ